MYYTHSTNNLMNLSEELKRLHNKHHFLSIEFGNGVYIEIDDDVNDEYYEGGGATLEEALKNLQLTSF